MIIMIAMCFSILNDLECTIAGNFFTHRQMEGITIEWHLEK